MDQSKNHDVRNNPITETNDLQSMFEHHGNQCLKFHFLHFLTAEDRSIMRCVCQRIKQNIPEPQYAYFKTKGRNARARIEKNTGFVETRGNADYGGDSSAVRSDLQCDVKTIYSTFGAFAALKTNLRVISWGHTHFGRASSNVSEFLHGIVRLEVVGHYHFRATKGDGSQIQWP